MPTTKVRRGVAPTIASENDIPSDATLPHKIPPPPLGKESKINLTKIPHSQAPLTLRLTNHRPRHLRNTPTPLDPYPEKLPLNADNLLPNKNKHFHDRHIEDRNHIKNRIKKDHPTPKANILITPRTKSTRQ